MSEVRIGVIGCGGMAHSHMNYMKEVPRAKFVAAADVVPASVQSAVEKYGVEGFDSGEKLLESGLVDAVLIATPHYFHTTYALAAFERGIHVLTEKPVAVTAKAAQAMADGYAAALRSHPNLKYGAMFQMRVSPIWKRIKHMIDNGELGEIRRILWVATHWFRTQAYYDSGSWRATWAGEGGGILLNQCPHDLDLLYWMAGSPSAVRAFIGIGKYHDIEVEDDVTSFWEYDNGATASFIVSTGEAPGSTQFEIVGDRGKITVADGKIEFTQNTCSADHFCRTTQARMSKPEATKMIIEPPAPSGIPAHRQVTENFIRAILDGEALVAPGSEGTYSLEIANAMIMSGVQDKKVSLPMDRESYETLLAELIDQSKAKQAAAVV